MKTYWELREELKSSEIKVGNYTTTHFHMCGSAIKTMKKHSDVKGAESLTKMQDAFYKMEKKFLDKEPEDSDKEKAKRMYDNIMAKAKKKAEKKTAPKKEKIVAPPKTKKVWNGESYDIVNI